MKQIILVFLFSLVVISCNKTAESAHSAKNLTDTLLQKNGQVLTYRKPAEELVSLKRDQTVYNGDYQVRIRKVAEYYIAGSQQNLLDFHKSKADSNLGFSFEENDWEGVNYTQIGIFTKVGSNMSTLQWLFYEPKSQKLYEFDLNTKKLQEFPLR